MALSGNIKTMPITDLLQWIEITFKTGIVEFKRGDERKKIYFQKGQILFVSSSIENEKMGRFLIRQGYLREEDLFKCLEENERTGKKLTEILEKRQLLSHVELYNQVVLLIKEILFDLFLWDEGTFEFVEGKLPTLVKGPLALKTGQVLFEVLTSIDEARASIQAAVQHEIKKISGQEKVRGKIVFKVDDKSFSLPGSYEKPNLSSLKNIEDVEGESEES